MSLHENYGSPYLQYNEYPFLEQSHKCGSAPFVPEITPDGQQNSCGSYRHHFNEKGCNKYTPNYPDDLYIMHHGCKGLGDCQCGSPPTYPVKNLHHIQALPAEPSGGCGCGIPEPAKLQEGFLGGGKGGMRNALFWIVVVLLLMKFLRRK